MSSPPAPPSPPSPTHIPPSTTGPPSSNHAPTTTPLHATINRMYNLISLPPPPTPNLTLWSALCTAAHARQPLRSALNPRMVSFHPFPGNVPTRREVELGRPAADAGIEEGFGYVMRFIGATYGRSRDQGRGEGRERGEGRQGQEGQERGEGQEGREGQEGQESLSPSERDINSNGNAPAYSVAQARVNWYAEHLRGVEAHLAWLEGEVLPLVSRVPDIEATAPLRGLQVEGLLEEVREARDAYGTALALAEAELERKTR
ncbi:hypothetical protein CONLIGDRAFT_686739 [Coniochaeta ligniaria NRRL 30616]|uniref:Uncharacterized protein n=1 Tax=Coniochaeta ligniaria NRRL 30616 TaxID=1408157 RepID=A0A1J7I723_9PEZI|nr:hypothetical protein CONLIGDRAFT_686739 [Coniochaeta ligniaria NRRL 30616]